NVEGGRCEACQGDGLRRIGMNFLPDVYVQCEVCRGKRYNRETLAVRYKGFSISELLETTVVEALQILENIPQIRIKLQTLVDVGLGYLHLGQSATTLSGGEAQRIKLPKELLSRFRSCPLHTRVKRWLRFWEGVCLRSRRNPPLTPVLNKWQLSSDFSSRRSSVVTFSARTTSISYLVFCVELTQDLTSPAPAGLGEKV